MWEQIEPRLRDLARRAGLAGVPPAVTAACLAIAVGAAVWSLWHWWPRGGEAVAIERGVAGDGVARTEESRAASASAVGTAGAQATLVVHVAGAVRRPGVYRLGPGSRVCDAVDAAGGLLPDAVPESVNLARPLEDGEQVVISSEDDVAAGAGSQAAGASNGGGGAASGSSSGLVNLNTADVTLLDTLPGVGPSTAQRIVADRDANGPFATVEDLGRVSGIGPKKLEQLKDLVSVR